MSHLRQQPCPELDVDSDGGLWLSTPEPYEMDDGSIEYEHEHVRLGPIEACADRIPDCLQDEYERLLQDYRDDARFTQDYYAGASWTYHNSRMRN